MDLRQQWAVKAHERGWKLLPANGKIPTQDGWSTAPPPTLDQVQAWAARGNLGLRTGDTEHGSGVFVIDFDFAKLEGEQLAAARALYDSLPPTPTVITGTGGYHAYFDPNGVTLGNSASKLLPGVDTRGRGGQVIFVGSIHPTTDQPYTWAPGLSPDDLPLAPLPAAILDQLVPRAHAPAPDRPAPAATDHDGTPYGKGGLGRIYVAISTAPKGMRNQTLNREAFGAWQLFAGGELRSEALVERTLFQAATACGLVADDGEAAVWATIRSAKRGGEAAPREAPARPSSDPRRGLRAVPNRIATTNAGGPSHAAVNQAAGAASVSSASEATRPGDGATAPAPLGDPPEVLIPGLHRTQGDDDLEIGNHDFVDAALASIPPGTIYRRGDVPGEITGNPGAQTFRALSNERMRILLDQHLRVCKWVFRKTDPAPWLRFEATNSDHARLVLEAAATHPSVRALKHLVSYPVFLADLQLAEPGWNENGGVFYDCPPQLSGISGDLPDHDRARAILDDLVIDFPWKMDDPGVPGASASRENYFGLLLTPMLRPAINGNVPMHMILSTTPGTGKTLLAGTILGGVYLNKEAPARHLGTNEEERQKTIVSLLQQGETIVHLDNLRDYLDSANIASLLTATEFSARRLGVNDSRPMPNNTILVTTGNNVKATQEIVRRSVPIWIVPTTDDPASRTDFKHPDLPAYLSEQRREVLAALVSIVIRWRDGERPKGLHPKGSFERWAEIVGGVLLYAGFAGWRSNERAWQREADTTGEDLRTLCTAWWEAHGASRISTSDVLDLVEKLGVLPFVQKAKDRQGRLMSLSRSVLARHLDSPISGWFLRRHGSGSTSYYYLEAKQ